MCIYLKQLHSLTLFVGGDSSVCVPEVDGATCYKTRTSAATSILVKVDFVIKYQLYMYRVLLLSSYIITSLFFMLLSFLYVRLCLITNEKIHYELYVSGKREKINLIVDSK